jgi:hypothetical protein
MSILPSTAEEAAIAALRQHHPRDSELVITQTIPNIRTGDLIVVDIMRGKERVGENYALITKSRGRYHVRAIFRNLDDLMTSFDTPTRGHPLLPLQIAIPAILAIAILTTLLYLAVYQATTDRTLDFPDFLLHAFELILGYYFGAAGSLISARWTSSSLETRTKAEPP